MFWRLLGLPGAEKVIASDNEDDAWPTSQESTHKVNSILKVKLTG